MNREENIIYIYIGIYIRTYLQQYQIYLIF